jgi:hypothetical protein
VIVTTQGQLDNLVVTGISTLGSVVVSSGIVSATSFIGDGSGLTGVISGVDILEEGSVVGTAITSLNFVGPDITATASGAGATITVSVSVPEGFNELDAALFS